MRVYGADGTNHQKNMSWDLVTSSVDSSWILGNRLVQRVTSVRSRGVTSNYARHPCRPRWLDDMRCV
uniref:Uncharacterized protein n=1 Tax=Timema bartmani TaxID=61472 RepID=A0A7R9FCP6_9NEOP|nr:unnamed protein product [Timema bartmani]